jgi:hypothetical protein
MLYYEDDTFNELFQEIRSHIRRVNTTTEVAQLLSQNEQASSRDELDEYQELL